ncbi:MAG TPA: hypothetical protein VK436_15910 [Methanocella sp.]|nr:hypothetical protein [Methanocella sp.]
MKIMLYVNVILLLCSACFTAAATAQDDYRTGIGLQPDTVNISSLDDAAVNNCSDETNLSCVSDVTQHGCLTVSDGHAPIGDTLITPPKSSGVKSIGSAGLININSVTPRETLPYYSGASSNYAATYIGACGIYSNTPYLRASSVTAKVNSGSVTNLQPGEIFVLHQWGLANESGWIPENDIVIGPNSTSPNNVDFTIYINSYANPWIKTISFSKRHNFKISIKTVNSNDTEYSRVEFSIYDLTVNRQYTNQYALPATQTMDSADIALEKAYGTDEPRPGPVLEWRTVSSFHVYDQHGQIVDLARSGVVMEWMTPGVQTAYYHDFKPLHGVENAQGNFSMTRFSPESSYPPHP